MKILFFLLLLTNLIYFLGQSSPHYINELMFGTPPPQAQILLLKEKQKE